MIVSYTKLHNAGVTGNMYRSIASIYCNTISCVKFNNLYTPWFNVTAGVRQGDALSPTLFPLYINDFVPNVIDTNIGIHIDYSIIGILLYANNICLTAESEVDLEKLLDIVDRWCEQWRMQVNQDKSNVVHFRKQSQPRTTVQFNCG